MVAELSIHIWELDPSTGKPESPYPVVSHTFRGKDRAEAEDILEAHLGEDAFLSAALTVGSWEGVGLLYRGVLVQNGKETPWDG